MSAAPKWPSGTLLTGLRMTADEYLALGETQERYELIDGVIVMSPSPIPPHSEIAAEIIGQLRNFRKRTNQIRVFPETDVRLSPVLVYRPDVVVYHTDRLPAGKLARLDLPPDLVIEILSPSTKPLDLVSKRGDYQRFGGGEYWVVDPLDGSVRCWRREDNTMTLVSVPGETLASSVIAGFVLDLAAVRAAGEGE